MWKTYVREHPQFGRWYVGVERQPSWVVKAAAIAGVLVIVVPVVLLTLAALVVAGLVFLVGSLLARILRLFGNPMREPVRYPADDGRENVRVIDR